METEAPPYGLGSTCNDACGIEAPKSQIRTVPSVAPLASREPELLVLFFFEEVDDDDWDPASCCLLLFAAAAAA